MSKLVWIDTETTGLNPKTNSIHQLAIMDDRGSDIIDVVPFPNCDISDKGLSISGKTREMIFNNKKSQSDMVNLVIDKYFNQNERVVVGGYNIRFDVEFLNEAIHRETGIYSLFRYIHSGTIDVMTLVGIARSEGRVKSINDKLVTICNEFDIEIDAHNALSDIQATVKLYDKLRNIK